MSYDFSFDKRQSVLLGICTLLVCILLIFAGYLLGLKNASSKQETTLLAVPSPPKTTEPPATDQANRPEATPSTTVPVQAPHAKAKPAAELKEEEGAEASSNDATSSSSKTAVKKNSRAFALQIGAFKDKANAEAKIKSLKEQAIEATILVARDSAGHTWFAVRAGEFPDLVSATQAAKTMSQTTSEFVIVRPARSL